MLPEHNIYGVYVIINNTNGKAYVGQSANKRGGCARRWYQHQRRLHRQRHSCRHLQHAWNLYGASAFTFSVLAAEPNPQRRTKLEQHFIDHYRIQHGVYNTAPATNATRETTKCP